jgi:hypothetical protein
MKRLILFVITLAAVAAFAAGAGEVVVDSTVEPAQACGGTVSCCNSFPAADSFSESLSGLFAVEDAYACGGAAGLWYWINNPGSWWTQCSVEGTTVNVNWLGQLRTATCIYRW